VPTSRHPGLTALGVAVLCFLLGCALQSGLLPVGLVHLWPQTGVVVAALLTTRRGWPAILAAGFGAEVAAVAVFGGLSVRTPQMAAIGALSAWLAARLLGSRAWRGPLLDTLAEVALLGLATIVATTVGATAGLLLEALNGWRMPPGFWINWASTHAMSVLLIAPAILAPVTHRLAEPLGRRRRVLEALALAGTLGVLLFQLFARPATPVVSPSWLAPVLLWAAVRFGSSGAALACLAVGVVALPAALSGLGPMGYAPAIADRLFGTQAMLAISAVTSLAAAAVVTERRRAEELLRESVSRFGRIYHSSMVGVLVFDEQGRVVEANHYALGLLGYTPEDVAAGEVTGGRITPPERQAEARLAWDTLRREGVTPAAEISCLRKDGARVWAALSAARLVGETPRYLALLLDVTAERRQLTLMAETQSSARIGGWEFELATGATFWTAETFRLHGMPPASQVPDLAVMAARYPSPGRERLLAAQHRARTEGTPFDLELQLRADSGAELDVRVTGRAELRQGAVTRVFGTLQDITGRKRLEQQFLQAQKMDGLGRLAGGVAHDLNNILTAIFGHTALLERSLPEGDPAREDVEAIHAAGDRAASLVAQLLAFARRQTLAPQPVDLVALLRGLERMLGRVIGEDIVLRAELPAERWLALADPHQLEQVVVNLAVNARDAMPGGGELCLAVRHAVLSPAEAALRPPLPPGPAVCLAVTDQGEGIPAEVLPHIFEPFFTTKPQGRGTGLGLATCYGIVQQAGGMIEVESTVGRGSTFRVWLPRVEPTAPARPADGRTPAATRGTEHLLLVEDDPAVRALALRALEGAGYQVRAAGRAGEVLALDAQDLAGAALLVTDVIMPEMSGLALAAELTARFPRLRVLYISGYAPEVIGRGLAPAGARLLSKPFTPDALVREVREVLDARTPA
jgi:two-component system cell cycle sensor histidine kinase/response regulator CckA